MVQYRLPEFLIRAAGPDARTLLHGLLTQDVLGVTADAPRYGGLLSPQGKVIADVMLWVDGPASILITCDPTRGPDLLRRLSMYRLRSDAALEDAGGALAVAYSPEPFEGAFPDPRFPDGALGWRKIVAAAEAAELNDGRSIFDAHRLSVGAPDLAHDAAPEEVFALEALFEELNGVDFHKGCFIGQENVSRMKRRATTRKKFCPIEFDGPTPQYGAGVTAQGVELGSVRSGADGRALALLRLDRALEAEARDGFLVVDGRKATLAPPPWLLMPKPAGEAI